MEYFEKRVVDADIYIDYRTMDVRFENKITFSSGIRKSVMGSLEISLLFFCALLFASFASYPSNFKPDTYSDLLGTKIFVESLDKYRIYMVRMSVEFLIGSFIGFCFIFMIFDIIYSSTDSRIRSFVFRLKRGSPKRILEIPNPSGTIVYECTGNSEPLIDMEYDKDIADSLLEVSLVKRKEKRKVLKVFKTTKRRMILSISFSRMTKGVLKISEY